jgi:hypothetical protein
MISSTARDLPDLLWVKQTAPALAASSRIVFVLCVPLSMPMKYSPIFASSQILGCVMVAGFGEPIKRNRRLRGKGSGPGNDEFFCRPFWKNAARAL